MKDYYKILGVTYSASDNEIRKAFKEKIYAYKTEPGNKRILELRKELIFAYKTLINSRKRYKYNMELIKYYNRSKKGNGLSRFLFKRK